MNQFDALHRVVYIELHKQIFRLTQRVFVIFSNTTNFDQITHTQMFIYKKFKLKMKFCEISKRYRIQTALTDAVCTLHHL
jgi:hypothetical protein